jgi:hypothetical protein
MSPCLSLLCCLYKRCPPPCFNPNPKVLDLMPTGYQIFPWAPWRRAACTTAKSTSAPPHPPPLPSGPRHRQSVRCHPTARRHLCCPMPDRPTPPADRPADAAQSPNAAVPLDAWSPNTHHQTSFVCHLDLSSDPLLPPPPLSSILCEFAWLLLWICMIVTVNLHDCYWSCYCEFAWLLFWPIISCSIFEHFTKIMLPFHFTLQIARFL